MIAVDERRGPVAPTTLGQSADLSLREPQDPTGFVDQQLAREQVVEDIQALPGSAVQADRLPRLLHEIEADKVAVRLTQTEIAVR